MKQIGLPKKLILKSINSYPLFSDGNSTKAGSNKCFPRYRMAPSG